MPELPDVEGFRVELARSLPGRRVRRVDVRDAGVLRNATPRTFGRNLVGKRFDEPRRHGKWLLLPTDGPVLMVHSGMTGHPYLDRGELRYADLRKLRGVWLAPTEDVTAVMGRQGADALGIDLRGFTDALRERHGRLKPTLMDQAVIAGLGNLLVDEICWQSRLHPASSVSDLDADDLRLLHRTMRRVLRTSVRHARVPGLPRWLTGARDGPDPSCPRCGTRLARRRIGGRTSVWCPHCQQMAG